MIWFLFYFFITFIAFGGNLLAFIITTIIYLISIKIAFSRLGEKILRFQCNVRQLETKREKEYLIPVFEDVYTEAKNTYKNINKNVEICIIDEMHVNACALGMRTVAVTRGAMETLTEDELKGFIAHELGHLYNFDTKASLLCYIGNGFCSIQILLTNLILKFLDILLGGFTIGKIFIFVIRTILTFYLIFPLYFSQFILALNSRSNEYNADKFALNIGFGGDLIDSLYLLYDMALSNEKKKLVDELKKSHPDLPKRIGVLEKLFDETD